MSWAAALRIGGAALRYALLGGRLALSATVPGIITNIIIAGVTWYVVQKISWKRIEDELKKNKNNTSEAAREIKRRIEDEMSRSAGKPPPNPFQNAPGASVSGLFPPDSGYGPSAGGGGAMTTQPVRLQPHDPNNPNKGRCQGGVARFSYIEFKDIVSAYTPIREDDKV